MPSPVTMGANRYTAISPLINSILWAHLLMTILPRPLLPQNGPGEYDGEEGKCCEGTTMSDCCSDRELHLAASAWKYSSKLAKMASRDSLANITPYTTTNLYQESGKLRSTI